MPDVKERVATVYTLANSIEPLLKDHHPAEQGAALAMLLAIWAAGHAAAEREEVLQMHLDSVRRMIPAVLEERFKEDA